MILSDTSIQERLKTKDLVIHPTDASFIQPASVDLRLGREFVTITQWNTGVMDFNSKPNYQRIEANEFIVPSGCFVFSHYNGND